MQPNIIMTAMAAAAAVAAPSVTTAKAASEATITIHAPIERIWTLVTNVNRWPAWNRAVQTASLSGPVAPGSVFVWKSGGMGIRSTFRDVAPRHQLTWTGVTLGTRAVHSWTFAQTDQGVVVTTHETFDGWLPTLLPGMMQKTLDDTLPALLQSLKTAAEAGL